MSYSETISKLQHTKPAVKDVHEFEQKGRTPRSVLPSSTTFNFYNKDMEYEKGGPSAYAKDTRGTIYGGQNPGTS
jgi:hypothetical protein